MRRLRRLFNRAQMEPDEVNILRGMLSAIQGGRARQPAGLTAGIKAVFCVRRM